ncbi:Fucose permease OS=Ureibacillus acetophenoni OX=614649 GN=SAMN05877842_11837 PE=4 SV=1 [Ureibacillus acetophenoni]
METSINALFPVYALRMDYDLTMVSMIISAFSVGGIITRVPLGLLGDRIGRRNVLLIALAVGTIGFGSGSFLEFSEILVGVIFFVSGMFLGSTFSLGITYMADLTPKELLPTGNLLCGIFFSIGSLMGPFIGGLYLQVIEGISFLIFMAVVLLLIFLTVLLFGKKFKVLT